MERVQKSLSVLAISLFLSLTAGSYARADYEIRDPNHLLDQVGQFLGHVSFDQAFLLGDELTGMTQVCRLVCKNGSCQELCGPAVQISTRVKEATPDTVTFVNQAGDDPDSAGEMQVTRAMYDRSQGNYVVLYLAEGLSGLKPGAKDYATIDALVSGSYRLENQAVVPALTVRLTQYVWVEKQQKYVPLPEALTVGQGLPSIAQLVMIQPNPDQQKTPLFRVLSVKRH